MLQRIYLCKFQPKEAYTLAPVASFKACPHEFELQCALKSNYVDSHLIRIDCVRTKRALHKTVTLFV